MALYLRQRRKHNQERGVQPLNGGVGVQPGLRLRRFLLERPTHKLGQLRNKLFLPTTARATLQSTKDSTLTWEGKRPVKYAESDTKYTDLSYDGNGMLTGIMQVQNYVIWGGAVATNVYSKEITRDGDRILSEKVTNIDGTLLTNEVKNIKYCYDADGICGMFVDGNQYFFRRNIFRRRDGNLRQKRSEESGVCLRRLGDMPPHA